MEQITRLTTKKICIGALLLAAGILLPQLFHAVGGPAAGGMLLPMHIPVLLAGMLLGPSYGLLLGMVTPLFSFLASGMPPLAKLPFMLLELTAYGALAGISLPWGWKGAYLRLFLAQAGGRFVYALALAAAVYILGLDVPPVASVWTAVLTGIPGILLQWILIPPLCRLLQRSLRLGGN